MRRQSRGAELPDDLPDGGASLQERTEQKDELARLIPRLQAMPEIDRAALLMRALEDLPYQEIALALGVSVSAAKVRVHRAPVALERWRDS